MECRSDWRACPASARRLPPLISNEQFSLTSTFSCGRATSHGSGRRSQLSGLLLLPAVLDGLLEHAVLISQAVADGRELHGGHRVQEACCQTSEPAVTQAGIGFLLEHSEPIEFLVFDGLLRERIEQKVRHIVGERPADEKLHREIVDAVSVLLFVASFSQYPSLRQNIAHRSGRALQTAPRADGRLRVNAVVEEQMAFVKSLFGARKGGRFGDIFATSFDTVSAPASLPETAIFSLN